MKNIEVTLEAVLEKIQVKLSNSMKNEAIYEATIEAMQAQIDELTAIKNEMEEKIAELTESPEAYIDTVD